jgi:hypothetical protein
MDEIDGDDQEMQEEGATMESGLLLAVVERGAELGPAVDGDRVPKGARRKAGASVRVTFMYYGLAGDGQISAERARRFTQQANFRRRELGLPHGSLVTGLGSWGGPENAPIKLFGFRLTDTVKSQQGIAYIEGVAKTLMPASLGDACKSLKGLIRDVEAAAKRAEQAVQTLPKHSRATTAQVAAVYLYTMAHDFYVQFNAAMRHADRQHAPLFFAYLRLLFSALDALSGSGGGGTPDLWRGVNLDLSHDHPEGSEIVWWGASSCTPNLSVAKGFLGSCGERTLFRVQHKSAVPIKNYSAFRGEEEWLLAPGARLKVDKVDQKGGGLREITLVELPPPRAIA